MEFRLLGPLEVRDGERLVALGGPKRRSLVALLLLAENRPVPARRLVDGMWGEEPPAAAASSLQNQLSRLRSVLGDRLETTASGYRLRVEPGEVDLDRFRRLLDDARGSEPAAAADRLREALALWRGPALADLEGEPAQAAAAHLDELRLTALEERVDADLALGRHADVVPELEALTAQHPFRERLWGQLVLALYRAGRQAAALDAYARARRTLVDELGAEPGPALRELHAQVLRHDAALGAPLRAPPAAQTADVRETRRVVTVVAGTFEVGDGADPEARREAVRRASAEAARTIERHGGTPASAVSGESCLGVFGVPRAHEDDAARAVRAAFELWSAGEIAAAGVATGEVVSAPSTGGAAPVSGAPLDLADGLRAHRRGVVVSERTWRLVRHAATGEADPAGHRITAVDPAAPTLPRRLDTPLVGRDAELADVVHELDRVRRARRPRLLTIFGEPGIGKTRLAGEAARRLRPDATVLVGRCVEHGGDATYAPLREVVTASAGDAAGLRAVMAGEPDGELVATRVAAAVTGARTAAPGAAAGAVAETAWAVRRLLEQLAREQPLVLVLEDVHWAAPGLLDVVEHVLDVGRAPILVVCLARRELLDSRPGWAGGKVNTSSLVLGSLSPRESVALLDQLLAGAPLAAEERSRIVEVAGGNPLYLEQLLAASLDEAADGVPDSIQAVLATRLDALPSDEREALDAAAVCGVTFSVAAVTELVGRDLRRPLDELVRRDLLRPAEVPLFGEETRAFGHALIHDASYRSIPKRRRAELHQAAAERVARVAEERALVLDELVGFHLEWATRLRTEIGESGPALRDLARRAARRLHAAGMRAYERDEGDACRELLTRAIALFDDADRERNEAILALAHQTIWTAERAAASTLLEQARRWAEQHEDRALQARITIAGHAITLWTDTAAPGPQLLDDVERAIAVLEDAGDHRGLAEAYQVQFHALDRGTLSAGPVRALDAALRHARLAGSPLVEGWAQAWLCIVLPFGDLPMQESLAYAEDALRTAPNEVVRAAALGATGLLSAMRGRFDEARRLVLESHSILAELGLVQAHAAHSIALAEVEIIAGDLVAAEQHLRRGWERMLPLGDRHSIANVAWRLALVLARTGRDGDAEQLTRVAEQTRPHGQWVEVWWRVLRAGVAARAGRPDEAAELVSSALTTADSFVETRMGVDVWIQAAGVLRDLGRNDEADELLATSEGVARRLGYAVSERRAAALRTPPPGSEPPASQTRSRARAADA